MRTAASFALLAFSACIANAQLDHILAPVADSPAAAVLDQAAVNPDSPDIAQIAASSETGSKNPRIVTGDDVLGELQTQLAAYFGLKGDLKLGMDHEWRPIPLPGKDCDITLTNYPADGVTGNFAVSFKIVSGGVEVGEWQTTLHAQLWQSVWVTQSRLDRGQSLDRSNLNSQKVDILRDKQTLFTDDIDPDGYDVAAGIGPGQPISKQDVVERPVIHRGDVVDVIASEGLLDIRMKALALEDGGINSLIKMRNIDSSKEVNAQILNENEVKVRF